MARIDHEYTKEIVCPYCGYKFSDSWEINSNEEDIGLVECGECEKEFYASRIITVDYSTEKARYGTCEKCKTENVVIEDYRNSLWSYVNLCVSCGKSEKDKFLKEYFESK